MNMKGMENGVSIILCTHNGVGRLLPTLNHLCALERIPRMELIIVDNASTDDTTAFCTTYLKEHVPYPWKVIQESQPGLIHARRRGMNESRYPYLLFCDDDNYLCPAYVVRGFTLLQKHSKIGALGGRGVAHFEGSAPEWFERYHYSFATGPQYDESGRIPGKAVEIYGAASFWRKDVLELIYEKGIQPMLTGRRGGRLVSGDDVEWCYLVQLAGYEIWYEEKLEFGHLMTAQRLNWDYYLALKAGIAAGGSLLLPYKMLLAERSRSTIHFLSAYLGKIIVVFYQYTRFRLVGLFVKYSPERELAFVTQKSRLQSFIKNGVIAYRHFKLLKSSF